MLALADNAAVGGTQGLEKQCQLRLFRNKVLHLLHRGRKLLPFAIHKTISVLDIANLLAGKAPTFQTFAVDSLRRSRLTGYQGVGGNVAIDSRIHSQECVGAHATKLMNSRKSAAYYPIAQMNVPRQCRIICKYCLIADNAVMRDMAIGHDPVVIAQHRFTGVLNCAAADCTKLANRVAITNTQTRRLTSVFLVLGVIANGGELIDVVVLADACRTVNNNVAINLAPPADLDAITNHGIRTYFDIVRDDCRGRNDGGGMNHFSSFLTRAIK